MPWQPVDYRGLHIQSRAKSAPEISKDTASQLTRVNKALRQPPSTSTQQMTCQLI